MKKQTQKEIILSKLQSEGEVDNVWAFHNYILRLGAIICELRNEGYDIETEYGTERVGKNTHYKLKVKGTLF